MRKAAWGVLALVVYAISVMRPVPEPVHRILGLALLVGYVLLSLDPPIAAKRLRTMMFAGFGCAIASIILILSTGNLADRRAILAVVDVLAVAVVALPLWFISRPMQPVFGAAAGIAAVGPFLSGMHTMGPSDMASVAAFALVAGACLYTAYKLENPVSATASSKKPRIVVAYDVQRLTDDEKAHRIAALEQRFRAGELEEHKYWDKRQEIESR